MMSEAGLFCAPLRVPGFKRLHTGYTGISWEIYGLGQGYLGKCGVKVLWCGGWVQAR